MARAKRDVRVLVIDHVDEEVEEEAHRDHQTQRTECRRPAPQTQRRADRRRDQRRTETQPDPEERIRPGQWIQLAHIDQLDSTAVHIAQQEGRGHSQRGRDPAGDTGQHQRLPAAPESKGDQLIDGHDRANHERDERAQEQAQAQQNPGEPVDAWSTVVPGLEQYDQPRQADSPCRGVMRLVQEQTLKTIDLE